MMRSGWGRERRLIGESSKLFALILLAGLGGLPSGARAMDLDAKPIQYSDAPANNPVSRLQQQIDAGKVKLPFDKKFGYLPALLKELKVPASSQMLVFSKTSLQRKRIDPRHPRAIYFGDEVYLGYCQRGKLMEVTVVDPQLGEVFYSLDQTPADKPRFTRQGDTCLICHGSSQNQGFPGNLVRSVLVDREGYPVFSAGSYRINQTSPLSQRWGGWYVTGKSGKQTHLGNLVMKSQQSTADIDNSQGLNVTDLAGRVSTSPYLTPHSDIVALMVLEHQTEMHNLITRANFQTRQALYEEADINRALGRPANYRSPSTTRRIQNAGEPLVKYLLFAGEARLTDPVEGTSPFTQEFPRRGPRDGKGRSLRDLDLKHRLFKYPCSYLIYSPAFDGLPGPVKDYVLKRVWEVLTGKDTSADFAHLTPEDRRAILEILRETKKGLPDYWKGPTPSPAR